MRVPLDLDVDNYSVVFIKHYASEKLIIAYCSLSVYMTVPIPSVGSNTRAMPCPCIMELVHNRLAQSRFNLDWIWFWSRLKGVLQSALYTLLVGLQLCIDWCTCLHSSVL